MSPFADDDGYDDLPPMENECDWECAGAGAAPTDGPYGESPIDPSGCSHNPWSQFSVLPDYMHHAVLGIDHERGAAALVLWPGSPTAPLRGRICPTYLMDARAVVVMISRLQAILKELRHLPVPPALQGGPNIFLDPSSEGEDETHS